LENHSSEPADVLCLQCFDAVGWAAGRASGLKKTERWGAGVVVVCLEQGADLHIAQLMPLPLTGSCFSKIQIGFTFLVPAHLGSPGKRAVKRACACMCEPTDVRGFLLFLVLRAKYWSWLLLLLLLLLLRRVRLFVCLRVSVYVSLSVWNYTSDLHQIFAACY